MDEKFVIEMKKKLVSMKTQILNNGILTTIEDLAVSTDDLPDEADLATNVINQQVSFNMRQREMRKLRAIEGALHRIDTGCYGLCEDCDEFIGKRRLETQPWTTLCIAHAEEYERDQQRFHGHNTAI